MACQDCPTPLRFEQGATLLFDLNSFARQQLTALSLPGIVLSPMFDSAQLSYIAFVNNQVCDCNRCCFPHHCSLACAGASLHGWRDVGESQRDALAHLQWRIARPSAEWRRVIAAGAQRGLEHDSAALRGSRLALHCWLLADSRCVLRHRPLARKHSPT